MPQNISKAAKYLASQLGKQAPSASSRVRRNRVLLLEVLESKTLLATNLVTNGGFETGDFSGWTLSGNQDQYTYVASASDDIEPPHSGNYAAMLGAIGADGNDNKLSQTLTTVPGQQYVFKFFYLRGTNGLSSTPSNLHVYWNGTDVYDEVNSPLHGYVEHDFNVTATGTSTTIEFDSRNDPWFDALDDVSVNIGVQSQFQSTDVLHKLLYANQSLAVNLSVTNGTDAEVSGYEAFYISTNQNASVQGDGNALFSVGNVNLDLQPGQSINLPQDSNGLTVTIPGTIQPGTYYLKAFFIATDDDAMDDQVAVSPALTTAINSVGQVSNFSSYPQNAALFDSDVTIAKQGNAQSQIPVINNVQDIANFVQGNENSTSSRTYQPYDDNGVPAVGFGSDLRDKNTGNVNATYQGIIQKYLDNNPNLTFTFQDFLNENKSAYIDKATANALFQAGLQVALNYVTAHYSNINMSQKAALVDIAYNIGTGGLAKFTSMNDDIFLGTPFDFAAAGLELVNSKRTIQVGPKRTSQDFFLLTNSTGVADQL